MSIHKQSSAGSPPGHMHRPPRNEKTPKQKAAEAQNKSLHYRKVPVTLAKTPWEQPHGK